MKRENLEKAQNAIEEARKIEYVLGRIDNINEYDEWGWEPKSLNPSYMKSILLNLTEDEKAALRSLEYAMTTIIKEAALRTLANINAAIESM